MISWAGKLRSIVLIMVCLMSSISYADDKEQAMGADNTFWENWKGFVERYTPLRYIPIEGTLEKMKETDPLESFNRKVFIFNDYADQMLLSPVAEGYQVLTPNVVEKAIGNVFSNLLEITTVVNDLLQGKYKQAVSDSARFLVNSTLGIVGIFDVASDFGLEKHQEDFGQTLGYWDAPPGPYVMVPLFGPYTIRSGFGAIAELQTDGIGNLDDVPTRNSLWATSIVHNRAQLLGADEFISGDRYTFVRDAYIQRREFLALDGILIEDDFGDDDFDGDIDDWDDE